MKEGERMEIFFYLSRLIPSTQPDILLKSLGAFSEKGTYNIASAG